MAGSVTWRLRSDLEIVPADSHDGRPAILVHDPQSGDFDRVEWPESDLVELLRQPRDVDELCREFAAANPLRPDAGDVAGYLNELGRKGWLRDERFWPAAPPAGKRGGLAVFLIKCLFVQIPLLRPEGFLEATAGVVRLLVNPLARAALFLAGVFGLFLALPRWEDYWRDSLGSFDLRRAPAFFLALALVKTAHEFAHAYAATLAGARVSAMGVAFFFFMPLPFTDVTDAWRLPWRRRLAVATAGMRAEAAVAGASLLLWALSPPGDAAMALARLSSVALLSTVLTNLNPGPRFDGYYILVCLLRLENLRSRGLAELRRIVWGRVLGVAIPDAEEGLSRKRRAGLLLYALYSLFYRASLGVGLALLAYSLFPKAFGLPLAAAELWLFFGHPLVRESRLLSRNIGRMRFTFTLALLLALAGGFAVWFVGEWPRRTSFPAVTRSAVEAAVRAQRGGVATEVAARRGDGVSENAVLARLESPVDGPLTRRAEWALREAELAEEQAWRGELSRRETGWRAADTERRKAELDALRLRGEYLTVTSPADGLLAVWDRDLVPGVSVGQGRLLGWVVRGPVMDLVCYPPMEMAERLEVGAEIRFFSDAGDEAVTGRIVRVDESRPEILEDAQLAGVLGAVRSQGGGFTLPRPYAKVEVRLDREAVRAGQTGSAWVWTRPESLLDRAWRWLKSLAVRESAF